MQLTAAFVASNMVEHGLDKHGKPTGITQLAEPFDGLAILPVLEQHAGNANLTASDLLHTIEADRGIS